MLLKIFFRRSCFFFDYSFIGPETPGMCPFSCGPGHKYYVISPSGCLKIWWVSLHIMKIWCSISSYHEDMMLVHVSLHRMKIWRVNLHIMKIWWVNLHIMRIWRVNLYIMKIWWVSLHIMKIWCGISSYLEDMMWYLLFLSWRYDVVSLHIMNN